MPHPSHRIITRFALVAFVAWGVAVPALLAQAPAAGGPVVDVDRWNITGFIGPGFGEGLNNSPLSLGAAAAYNFTSRLAVEGELGYTRGAAQSVLFDLNTGIFSLSANAIYHFGETSWVPYGTIGLGLLRGSTDLSTSNLAAAGLTLSQIMALGLNSDGTDSELALNLGGGVKRRFSDRVNFRGDLRYFGGRNLVPSFWRAYVGLGFVVGR